MFGPSEVSLILLMMLAILLIIICVVGAIIFGITFILISNKLNRAIVKINEASSGIDVGLTKRYDVLTKMLDVVKGYTKYEQETLFKIVELRKEMSMAEKDKANADMGENYAKIKLLAENYPDLKANENYRTLQQAIVEVEEHLQAARRLYNANVSSYNQMIVSFPTSRIARFKGLTKQDFFEAEENKKQDVKMDV